MTIANSIVLSDNSYGTLASGLTVSDATLIFTTGHGARFPAVAAGQVLYCVILNSTNVVEEIQITAHTSGSDSATIVRGANSTTAKTWSAGDRVEARISSEVLRRLQQEALIDSTAITTADAGATYTGTMSPSALGYINGAVYPLTLVTTNSGAGPTIALNGLVAVTVKLDGAVALSASQMPLNGLYKYDGTNFILLNPKIIAGVGIGVSGNTVSVSGSTLTNSLSADVTMNDTTLYFTGPTVAQGTTGTWFAHGVVTVRDAAGAAAFNVKLWDGTTVISSTRVNTPSANVTGVAHLSGYLASPAGNIRISVKDVTTTNGTIAFNDSGNSKDGSIFVIRIA